jgi:hypothetical protein
MSVADVALGMLDNKRECDDFVHENREQVAMFSFAVLPSKAGTRSKTLVTGMNPFRSHKERLLQTNAGDAPENRLLATIFLPIMSHQCHPRMDREVVKV